jgi:hypothetical protein
MTGKLAGVAIAQSGNLYEVPTAESNGYGATRTLAASATDGLLRLLGKDVFFKFQDKAFELAPNANSLEDVDLDTVLAALQFACGADSKQVMALQELPEDPNAPTYR